MKKLTKLGQYLRKKREDKGLSRKQVSDRMLEEARITASTVGQIERGEIKRPPESRLAEFARILKVSLAKLKSFIVGTLLPVVIAWFSCGITSAVACKIALEKYGPEQVKLVCIDAGANQAENTRFKSECERWYSQITGQKVEIITVKNEDGYVDHWDVIAKTNYLNGVNGARCTTELKRKVNRLVYKIFPNRVKEVFGFDATETKRAEDFLARKDIDGNSNTDKQPEFPLIDQQLTKANCMYIAEQAGIKLPENYNFFCNNNCLGCVKGGIGYWNQIRRTNPDVFDRMAREERRIGHALNRQSVNGKRRPVFLDELDPEAGRQETVIHPQAPDCPVFADTFAKVS